MRAAPLTTLVLAASCAATAPDPGGASIPPLGPSTILDDDGPALVVLVSVDQLRADLLDRYDDLFQGGLRRLRDEGFRFTRASHNHANTATAPGHATLATGTVPARSGIVANQWYEQEEGGWRARYSVEDPASPIVGYPDMPGRSPENLLRGGLADWIREANPSAQVVSVSRKDRSAITLAGKTRGHVYWMASPEARFVTSSFYRDSYPEWITRLNDSLPELAWDSVWTSTVPAGAAVLSRRDTASYENDGVHTYFPHAFAIEQAPAGPLPFGQWVAGTPAVDAATLAVAMRAVEELGLGRGEGVDYLAVSLSQTDAVGHSFGPLSREQLDNLLRMDRELGRLLEFLDATVGEGRWVLGFSADHGVLTMPEYLQEQGLSARRLSREDLLAVLERTSRAGQQGGDDPGSLAAALAELPFVARAAPVQELLRGEPADSFVTLFRNSYLESRPASTLETSGVNVRWTEGTLTTGEATGTSHGSPYWYDRHVPLVFLGAGVTPGESAESAYTYDLAPTLANLAGVAFPSDVDGRPLLDLAGAR